MKTNKNLSFNDDTIYEWWKWMHILKGIYSIVRIWSFVFAFEQWLSYTGEDKTSVAAVCFNRPNVLTKAGEWLVADGLPFTLKAEYLFQWRITAVVEKKWTKFPESNRQSVPSLHPCIMILLEGVVINI